MPELFRLESPNATVRWTEIAARPTTVSSGTAYAGHLSVLPNESVKCVFPGTEPPLLFEQTDYRLAVRAKKAGQRIQLVHRDQELVRGVLAPEDGVVDLLVGTINFRNQVGRSRFDVLVGGRHEFTFEVEVFPAKLNYREDFEQILAEVQDVLTALAFEFLASTYVSGQTTEEARSELEWALLLRRVVEDLERGLRHVAEHPIRSLRREPHQVRADRVRRVDSMVRHAVRTGRGGGECSRLADGTRIHAFLPTTAAEPTLDTLEHRWLAHNLEQCRSRLSLLLAEEAARPGRGARGARALAELGQMLERLDTLTRIEPLVAATRPPPRGFSSLQLLGAPGYREAYTALITLQLGLRLEGNALELSLKDIATLYEYWCYLALVALVSERTGRRVDPSSLIRTSEYGLQVMLKKGRQTRVSFDLTEDRRVSVEYNRSFQNHVLLAQKPDIVIAIEERGWPTTRVILDAKYRIDASSENVEQLGLVGPPSDALNVLHRYRDAILTEEVTPDEARRLSRSVVYAAALFPSNEAEDTYGNSPLYQQLQSVGIGGVPFLPSNRQLLARWLDGVLNLNAWALAQTAPPAAPEAWVWKAASEVVLVGVLRSNARQHLEWVLANRCYYIPETAARHGRQALARHVALYLPRELNGGQGGVCWVGEVTESATLPRDQVETPWENSGRAELVRLYTVRSWQPLQPIRNEDGQRFSRSRWSNALALRRAKTIDQLFLESPLEWALYDRLCALGLRPTVRADALRGAPDVARGRARLLLDGVRLRYAGANGFRLHVGESERLEPTVERATEACLAIVRDSQTRGLRMISDS